MNYEWSMDRSADDVADRHDERTSDRKFGEQG